MATGPEHTPREKLVVLLLLALVSTRVFFFSSSDMGMFFLHHTPPPPLPTLLSLYSSFFFFCFPDTSPYFYPVLPTPSFIPSFSLLLLPLPLSPPPTIPLTLFSLQLPEEFSNDLNETPAFSIFNNPPCYIPKRILPCTAIRKPVPGAAASAVSAWRSSLPSSGREEGLHKVGSTVSMGTDAAAESQEGFPKPSRSLSLCSCPPSGYQLVSAQQQYSTFCVPHTQSIPPARDP